MFLCFSYLCICTCAIFMLLVFSLICVLFIVVYAKKNPSQVEISFYNALCNKQLEVIITSV